MDHPNQKLYVSPLLLGIVIFSAFILGMPGTAMSGAALKFIHKPLTSSENQVFSRVKELMDQNQTQRAAQQLEQYFKRHLRRHSYGYELYGHLLLALNNNVPAVSVLEQGVEAYPDCPSLVQNLAVAYARTGQPALAGKFFWQAYRINNAQKDALAFSSAYYFSRAKQQKKACNILSDLIAGKGMTPQWVLLLAQCRMALGEGEKAAALLASAVQTHPQEPRLWKMLGWIHFNGNRPERAAAALKIAATLGAGGPDPQLARLFLNLGAVRSGDRITRDAPAPVQDYMAVAYSRSGDLEKALDRAKSALEKRPSNERRFRLARILFRMGRFTDARVLYEELARSSDQFQTQSQWALVVMAWRTKNWPEALAHLKAIKAAESDLPIQRRAARLIPVLEKLLS